MRVEFVINGRPVAKERVRVVKYGRSYTPKKTRDYERLVKQVYELQVGEYLGESALLVEIDFYFTIPKSYTKKRIESIKNGQELYTKRPDLDNLAKTVTDALNGIAYKDDNQIIEMKLRKHYGDEDKAVVAIEELF